MENLQFSVKALAALMEMTIAELAEAAGIKPQHLLDVSSGRVRMLASDAKLLSDYTNIPIEQIKV